MFEQLNTDEAHFIYEILQNADDVKATTVTFELMPDKLVFRHNGTTKFTLNNKEPFGHINAITSFGNSTKGDQPEIGKFGIGFKTVYKYTRTPSIYEDNFKFRIENYFVPDWLTDDYPNRTTGETVFVFPFDNPKIKPKECYDTILRKLKELYFPTLYLNNLTKINWICGKEEGTYSYETLETGTTEIPGLEKPLDWQKLVHIKGIDGHEEQQHLLQFHRIISVPKVQGGQPFDFRISVTYLLDEQHHLEVPNYTFNAFCFFPTHYETGLKYMIHAPFLLSANREGLEVSEVNRDRITELATLAANSIYGLRESTGLDGKPILTDKIFEVIRIRPDRTPDDSPNNLSFNNFYQKTLNTIKVGRFMPTENGTFMEVKQAKWADSNELAKLFDRDKLARIDEFAGADWVFRLFSRRQNEEIRQYAEELGIPIVAPNGVLNKIKAAFIEQQSDEWLRSFYRYLNQVKGYSSDYPKQAFFLNKQGKAVSIQNKDGIFQLFLPHPEGKDRPERTIKETLLQDGGQKDLESLGLKERDRWDEIKETIADVSNVVESGDTELLTMYWNEFLDYNDKNSHHKFHEILRGTDCVPVFSDNKFAFKKPGDVYLRNEELLNYFNGRFGDLLVDEGFFQENDTLCSYWNSGETARLLRQIGVKENPDIQNIIYNYESHDSVDIYVLLEKFNLNHYYVTDANHWSRVIKDKQLLGFDCIDDWISPANSAYVLNVLKDINSLRGIYNYRYYADREKHFKSTLQTQLETFDWLYDKEGNRRCASELSFDELADDYELTSAAKDFLVSLGVQESQTKLTPQQQEAIGLWQKVKTLSPGISDDEIFRRLESFAEPAKKEPQRSPLPITLPTPEPNASKPVVTPTVSSGNSSGTPKSHVTNLPPIVSESGDNDSIEREIELLRARFEADQERINNREPLLETVRTASQYSFARLKALLELESQSNRDDFTSKKAVDLVFAKAEIKGFTLTLRQPSRPIPYSLEDKGDMTISLVLRDSPDRKIKTEVVSVKDFSLQARIAKPEQIAGLAPNDILSARIQITDPTFLLDSLKSQFDQLPFADTDDLRDCLPRDIKFVFGPPGTGKTTWLANWLTEQMQAQQSKKILVLTPTNKAADVICRRIISPSTNLDDYPTWLHRFGTTVDSQVENLLVDSTFSIDHELNCVVATTVARFMYDSFKPEGQIQPSYLCDVAWDYVVFDEASMIPLISTLFVIHKTKSTAEFVVAGDPFQIQPVTRLEELKGQTIYSAVGLTNFDENVLTQPHQFPIIRLTTQYRSIPALGELFSRYCYEGKLTHARNRVDVNLLRVGEDTLTPINIIQFPVNAYETLFRLQRLNKSAYQIYSALFVFELARYLATIAAAQTELEKPYTIGIICPYKAQATIIEKLLNTARFNDPSVEITVGTIHGFQGDQGRTVIALLNPPAGAGPNASINDQNILNVAISRAQDHQFLITPAHNIDANTKLTDVRQIESIAIQQNNDCTQYTSESWETVMLGAANYIREHSFVTSHQTVNVYDQSQIPYQYEIRCEEDTIDVLLNTI